jgi:hypothetical protein
MGQIQRITQNNWNIDQMDGTGPSGLNLQFNKTQLFTIDLEWLGVGRLRFGFFAYGKIQYCHQITNINALTAPYIMNINLPIRYELLNPSTVTATPAYMMQICSTVISEGGYTPVGIPFSIALGSTSITLSTSAETPVLVLRASQNATSGQNNNNHVNIVPTGVNIATITGGAMILLRVRFYKAENIGSVGTISTWNEVGPDETNATPNYSAAQYAIGTDITGFSSANSFLVNSNYCYTQTSSSINDLSNIFNDQVLHVTCNVSGSSDYLVVTATALAGNNPKVYASLNWVEYY